MRVETTAKAVDLTSLVLAGAGAFCLSLAASFGLLLAALAY
jgi:hypothetical protein